jgi:CRP/FNR family transcriptional regulator
MTVSLKDVPLFQGLSPTELTAVKECLIEKKFEKGEMLFHEGALCERVFIVQEGRVKIYRTASSGREQTLETLGVGDTCACNPGNLNWSCQSSAEALTPCKVWFLSRDNYVRMVQTNAKVSQALNRLFAERLRCFGSLIEEVSLKDSKKRLVKFLLDMLAESESKGGKGQTLLIPFTHDEIAQRIGMARETVTRQLHQLKDQKMVDIGPRAIVIRDKEGLKKLL